MTRKYAALFSAISESERLADLPDHAARLFYTWLLPHCDSHGRSTASPRVLNARVWPLLGETPETVGRILSALDAAGLVEAHEVDGERFLQVPDWEEKAGSLGHKGRRGASKYPDPTDNSRTSPGPVLDQSPRSRARVSSPLISSTSLSGVGGSGGKGRKQAETAWQVWGREDYAALRASPVASRAWSDWLEHTREPGSRAKTPRGKQAAAILNQALREGPERFAAAVEYAIAGNYLQPTYRDARASGRAEKPANHERALRLIEGA